MVYEYRAALVKVVDGDTVHADVDLGCDVHVFLALRLVGLDCPERGTIAGKAATDFTIGWFEQNCPDSKFTICTEKDRREKYGRYLATVIAPNMAILNQALLNSGNAVAYSGGKR